MNTLYIPSFAELIQWSKDNEMPDGAMNAGAIQVCVSGCKTYGRCGNLTAKDWCEIAAATAILNWAEEEKGVKLTNKKNCLSCINNGTDKTQCEGCLDNNYANWEAGDSDAKLLEMQRSGERNIVIGGEGEMEVNALWGYEEAYMKLFDVAEQVGGMVYREGPRQLLVTKAYDNKSYLLFFENGGIQEVGFPKTGPPTLDRIISQTPQVVWSKQ